MRSVFSLVRGKKFQKRFHFQFSLNVWKLHTTKLELDFSKLMFLKFGSSHFFSFSIWSIAYMITEETTLVVLTCRWRVGIMLSKKSAFYYVSERRKRYPHESYCTYGNKSFHELAVGRLQRVYSYFSLCRSSYYCRPNILRNGFAGHKTGFPGSVNAVSTRQEKEDDYFFD